MAQQTRKFKADLITYGGGVGFQRGWRFIQGNWGNLLNSIYIRACKTGMDIIGITSVEERGIPQGSVHDRFGYLKHLAQYEDSEGGEACILYSGPRKREGKTILFLNSQKVITLNDGQRGDFFVIGSNQVPNHLPLEDALDVCDECGLVKIAPPKSKKPYGLDVDEIRDRFDAQMEDRYGEQGKVATSSAHSVREIGTRCIEFESEDLLLAGQEEVLQHLQQILRKGQFTTDGSGPSKLVQWSWKIPLLAYMLAWEKLGLKRFYGIKRKSAI